MTRYRAALAAAARGWPVVPLRPHGKEPALRGWDDEATLDRDRIRHWWSRRAYNVGVSCGPAGLLVVDLDVPHEIRRVDLAGPALQLLARPVGAAQARHRAWRGRDGRCPGARARAGRRR